MVDEAPFMKCVVCGKSGPSHAHDSTIGAKVVGAVDDGWVERTRNVWVCPECREAETAGST
jgi:predicted RNA-binding protein YlxR (DUF448 family)